MLKALVVIAQEGYQDKELEGTRNGLLAADFEVILAVRRLESAKEV